MTHGKGGGFHPSILRAYDIRGIVGETLFEKDFFWLGLIIGNYIRETLVVDNPVVAMGYDGRLTSESFADHLCEGLVQAGVKVYDVGCGPTPLVSFAHYHLKTHGGLMITGSHNPASFNGLKITVNFAPFYGDSIQNLQTHRQGLEKNPPLFIPGGKRERVDLKKAYREKLYDDISVKRPLKVIWDTGNGATGEVIAGLVRMLTEEGSVTSVVLNEEIDGHFPAHHPDPTVAENLHQLIEEVRATGADVGIAFDGDGDRLGVVDGTGRIIWGDQLMILFAKDVLSRHPGASIIGDIKSSGVLFDKIREMGGVPIMEKTGHSHIKAALAFHKAPLAGELSGHIFFKDRYYGFDDALYAALRLLEIISYGSQSLHSLIEQLPQTCSSPEIRWACSSGEKETLLKAVKNKLQASNVPFNDTDGVRVSLDYGWWGLRVSHTEEAVTLRLESYKQEDFPKVEEAFRQFLPPEWKEQKI